jgi:hypothetical protein
MKTRSSLIAGLAVAALLQPALTAGAFGAFVTTPGPEQAGAAVLSVSSGFTTSPNPLAGRTMVLFKESFGASLKRTGTFQGPPGSTMKESPLAVWVYACQTRSPTCQQALYEARPNSVSEAKMDANARATLPGVPPGTYYLFAVAGYNNQFLVWDLRVDLKPGANSITLDQRNTASLDADSARSTPPSGGSQPVAASRPCQVDSAPKAIKPGALANSALSVIGAGYVYTYTKTDRRTGAVADSFTERGNFSNTTLYLLDEDADTILQKAGVQPGLLGSRLATLTLFDAGTQVEHAPGMDLLTSILGQPGALAEFTREAKADFDCAMKAIRAHSVAEMTTDANARGVFPNVPPGTYYLFGRFYRITKPVRGGGMLWNLSVDLKPGQNVRRLSVDDAALK